MLLAAFVLPQGWCRVRLKTEEGIAKEHKLLITGAG